MITTRITDLVEPILDELGFELVDVEYLSERGRWVLRMYIEKEGGVTIDDCAMISRELGDLIDIKDIIEHEYVHIKQYHTFDILLLELILILQWFNPFVWPYKGSLKEIHEYLADDGVIAQGYDPAGYQMLILEQSVGVKLFGYSNSFNHSQINSLFIQTSQFINPLFFFFKI